jgi:hypothetical protein
VADPAETVLGFGCEYGTRRFLDMHFRNQGEKQGGGEGVTLNRDHKVRKVM